MKSQNIWRYGTSGFWELHILPFLPYGNGQITRMSTKAHIGDTPIFHKHPWEEEWTQIKTGPTIGEQWKSTSYFPLYTLFNRDPCFIVYEIIPTKLGSIIPGPLPKNNQFFFHSKKIGVLRSKKPKRKCEMFGSCQPMYLRQMFETTFSHKPHIPIDIYTSWVSMIYRYLLRVQVPLPSFTRCLDVFGASKDFVHLIRGFGSEYFCLLFANSRSSKISIWYIINVGSVAGLSLSQMLNVW